MTQKKIKIDIHVGSKWYTFNNDMKKCIKKETVVNVTSRTFTLKDETTKEERKIWRYANKTKGGKR